MAKDKFEKYKKIELVGTLEKIDDHYVVNVTQDKDFSDEIDFEDILDSVVGETIEFKCQF